MRARLYYNKDNYLRAIPNYKIATTRSGDSSSGVRAADITSLVTPHMHMYVARIKIKKSRL